MQNKHNFRLLIVIQAFFLAGFGLILKNMDDAIGNKLLWTGAGILALFILKASFRFVSKNFQKKESV